MSRPRTSTQGSAAIRALAASCLGLAGLAAAAGVALGASLYRERPSPGAEIDGLQLRVERATWLDADEESPAGPPGRHDVAPTWRGPRALVPGTPARTDRHLALTFVARNATRSERRFAWDDLVLRTDSGPWAGGRGGATRSAPGPRGVAADALGRLPGGEVVIPPGHAVVLDASFDVRETDARLALWWERGDVRERVVVTRAPRQGRRADGPPRTWPRAVSELPPGRAPAGDRLFHGRLACATCHGDPAVQGSGGAGPPLGAIGSDAGLRQRDRSAPQYLYESILDPSAFTSPACAGQPCAGVEMPGYGEVLSLQDAADLVTYLLAQRRAAAR